MNARLAARLTGWKVDIQSEREFAEAEAEAAFGGSGDGADEFSGRCAAILANGKRCPNAALPGTRFCGVPAHQALAKVEAETGGFADGSVQPVPPSAEGEEEAQDADAAEAASMNPAAESTPPEAPADQAEGGDDEPSGETAATVSSD
jgi:transcription termination/antitermination protein NusA